jgi:hypothetical protein
MSNFMKIYPLEAELFNTDGEKNVRRDMAEPITPFRNSTKAPKTTWRVLLKEQLQCK